jgi:hypothetical protein
MTDKRPGRTLYGTPATDRVVVRVTPAQRIELRRVADATGSGVSGVIRELIDIHVEGRRPPGADRDDDT